MPSHDFRAARLAMVDSQLRPNQVSDPALLQAFAVLPREQFLPESLQAVAYLDDDLPLDGGRCLIEPRVLGRLIQAAAIAPGERALAIGDPTGYAAAVLARLAGGVVLLENDAACARAARALLASLGIANVAVAEGALAAGHAPGAPYDVILLAGAAARIPPALSGQLAEGGRLVFVRREAGKTMGEGTLAERVAGALSHRALFDAGTPFLPGFAPAPSFVF